jgi:hypothetical protein
LRRRHSQVIMITHGILVVGPNNYIEVRCTECGLVGCCHVADLLECDPADTLCCYTCQSDMLQSRWGPLWPWKGPPVTIEEAVSEYNAWIEAYAEYFRERRQRPND